MRIRIGLLGFGKTGKLVANEILNDKQLNLKWVIRKKTSDYEYASEKLGIHTQEGQFYKLDDINSDFFKKNKVDVVIDFSNEKSSTILYSWIAESSTQIVTAISKYSEDQIELIKKLSTKISIMYSPNITLGINWLIIASKILRKIVPEADVEIIEEHFREKPETSGTALKIAEHLGLDKGKHVNSIRVGGVVGKHEIVFGLPNQTIRLTHESINRSAFGRGAIAATKWILDKPPGLYTMEQYMHDRFVHKLSEIQI